MHLERLCFADRNLPVPTVSVLIVYRSRFYCLHTYNSCLPVQPSFGLEPGAPDPDPIPAPVTRYFRGTHDACRPCSAPAALAGTDTAYRRFGGDGPDVVPCLPDPLTYRLSAHIDHVQLCIWPVRPVRDWVFDIDGPRLVWLIVSFNGGADVITPDIDLCTPVQRSMPQTKSARFLWSFTRVKVICC